LRVSIPSVTGIPALKAAVKKAIALHAKDRSIDLSLSYIDKFSLNQSDLEICQNLWKLCFSYEKEELLEEASITLDLIRCGYSRFFGSSSLEAMRCIVYKARILRMLKDYKNVEAAYNQAIKGLGLLGQTYYQLRCQLLLSQFFQSLDRNSAALNVLVKALMEHLSSATMIATTLKRGLGELLDTLQQLHSKISINQDMAKLMPSLDRLREVLQRWSAKPKTPEYFLDAWREFVQLVSTYSELKKLNMADRFFAYPKSKWLAISAPVFVAELARLYKVRCLHFGPREKMTSSPRELERAFDYLISVKRKRIDQPSEDLFAVLEKLLNDYPLRDLEGSTCSSELGVWLRAQKTYVRPQGYRPPFRRMSECADGREWEIPRLAEPTSISSHASSLFSSASTSSRFGLTYSVGSASSMVSNSAFMVS
jgi:hypothetical protein